MRIYAISVVKNEADVIEANLRAASKWATKIFILDNGSTDGTWEKVLAMQDDIITPWKQDAQPFRNQLRSLVFNEFQHYAQPDDWWCIKLDADEFYHDDPREFLKKVPSRYHYVCGGFVQFQLTKKDVIDYAFTGNFEKDRAYIKYFVKELWVEARFVRHRRRLTWSTELPFPKHMGIVFPKLIIVLHYQYRSPAQIQLRLSVRKNIKATGKHFRHVHQLQWEDALWDFKELYSLDQGIDFYKLAPENKYLHAPHKFIIKKILYWLKILP